MFEDPVCVYEDREREASEKSTQKLHADVYEVKHERMGSTELQSVLRALENELDIAEAFIEPVHKKETPIVCTSSHLERSQGTTEKYKHNQCMDKTFVQIRQKARKKVLNRCQQDLLGKPVSSIPCEIFPEDQHIGERRYCCHFCKKQFTKKFKLIIHVQMHNKGRRNYCIICNVDYVAQINLKNHMYSHSIGEVNAKMPWTRVVNYLCTFCNKRFLHESLSTNIRKIRGKPYSCSACYEILTNNKPDARRKRYACEKCSEQFEDAFDLVMHKRSHASAPKSYSRVRRS